MSINIYERTYQSIGDEFLEEARACVERARYTFAALHYAQAIKSYLQNALPFSLDQTVITASDLWEALVLCQTGNTVQSPISIPALSTEDARMLRALDSVCVLLTSPSQAEDDSHIDSLLENLEDGVLLSRVEVLAQVAQAASYCATVYNQFTSQYGEADDPEEIEDVKDDDFDIDNFKYKDAGTSDEDPSSAIVGGV